MLIEKKFSDSDVVSLKLVSGEEIIGRFEKENDDGITLSKPMMIAMTPKGPAMAPVMMTADPESTLTFNKRLITISTISFKEVADQYVFQTTGIQPVSSGSIITR